MMCPMIIQILKLLWIKCQISRTCQRCMGHVLRKIQWLTACPCLKHFWKPLILSDSVFHRCFLLLKNISFIIITNAHMLLKLWHCWSSNKDLLMIFSSNNGEWWCPKNSNPQSRRVVKGATLNRNIPKLITARPNNLQDWNRSHESE